MVKHQRGYQLKHLFHKDLIKDLLFLIYINDLSIDIISTIKLFADGTSLFSIIHDAKTTAYEIKQRFAENN